MSDFPLSFWFRFFKFGNEHFVELSEEGMECRYRDRTKTLRYKRISNKPQRIKGLLWDKITVSCNDGETYIYSGIKKSGSAKAFEALFDRLGSYHVNQFNPAYQQINISYQYVKSLFGNWYTRYSKVEKWRKEYAALTIR